MYFDRFDIVTAHWMHAMLHHSGQASKLYAKMCRIMSYFTPSPLMSGPEDLNDNARAIYEDLCERCV